MINDLKVFGYGIFWLILCSPVVLFIVIGVTVPSGFPSAVGLIGLIAGTYIYCLVIWIPVRVKMVRLDTEFLKRMRLDLEGGCNHDNC